MSTGSAGRYIGKRANINRSRIKPATDSRSSAEQMRRHIHLSGVHLILHSCSVNARLVRQKLWS